MSNFILRLPSRRFRNWYVRHVLRWPMGEDVQIGRNVRLQAVKGITIGSRVYIHRYAELDLRGGIVIGSDVAISPSCRILTADHDPDSPTRDYRERQVTIGDRVWIATGATLMPGTHVSEGCVVAGGAVAAGRLDEWGIYVGNPVRRVRDRAPDAQDRLAGRMRRFQ